MTVNLTASAAVEAPPAAVEPSGPVELSEPVEPFEAFYRAHLDRVYRALAVTLADSQLAREAADEAMARAYAHWRRVRGLDNPGGWVYRVGLNWATSWRRKVRRERVLPEPGSGPVAGTSSPPPDPAGLAAQQALAQLPLAQRVVVVCRVLLDLSTIDTAAVLGVAEGTVKSRLARGLATLRTTLTEPRTEPPTEPLTKPLNEPEPEAGLPIPPEQP